VVDLNIVSRDAVVQEVGREHHVVSLVPELRVVLVVELHDIARADESEARDDQSCEPEPHEEGRVVERTLRGTNYEAREDWTHHSEGVIDLNPVVVYDTECAAESVSRVLTLTHLEGASDLTDETASLCETLVDDVLHRLEATALEEPSLKSLRHYSFYYLFYNQ